MNRWTYDNLKTTGLFYTVFTVSVTVFPKQPDAVNWFVCCFEACNVKICFVFLIFIYLFVCFADFFELYYVFLFYFIVFLFFL